MLELRRRIAGFAPLQQRAARIAAWFSLAVLALHWALIVQFVAVRAGALSFLRLHYTAALGVDWVGSWWLIFTFPLFGLATFVVNLRLAGSLSRVRPAFGTIMMVATALLQLLFAAAGSIAILLNS